MNCRRLRLLAICSAAVLLPLPLLAGTTITVLHVNDTHSHLDSFGPKDAQLDGTLGGLTRAATIIRAQRAAAANPLLLHAGDFSVGDFFYNMYYGVPELQLLQGLGLAAMTVGNHEFDLGPGTLAAAALAAGLPDGMLLSANADTSGCAGTPAPPAGCPTLVTAIKPWRIVDVAGVKVGILGMTTADDPTMRPSPVKILGPQGGVIGIALAKAAELRPQVDVLILMSHLGLTLDKLIATSQPLPLIDFIVEGHDHDVLTAPIEVTTAGGWTTRIVSAGEFYSYVGRLRFTVSGTGTVDFDDYTLLPVGPDVVPDPVTKATVDYLKLGIVAKHGDVYHEPISRAPWNIERHYDPASPIRDTAMGNLVTDSYRFKTGTEIGLAAIGYISERIYKGPVVGADLFRPVAYGVDPYNLGAGLDFPLMTFGLKGSDLVEGMEVALGYLGMGDTFFLQFSGLRYQYDSTRPKGSRVVPGSIHVGGQLLDPDRVYTVTTNLGVAIAAQTFMKLPVQDLAYTGIAEYTALRDYVKTQKNLTPHPNGRIKDISIADEP